MIYWADFCLTVCLLRYRFPRSIYSCSFPIYGSNFGPFPIFIIPIHSDGRKDSHSLYHHRPSCALCDVFSSCWRIRYILGSRQPCVWTTKRKIPDVLHFHSVLDCTLVCSYTACFLYDSCFRSSVQRMHRVSTNTDYACWCLLFLGWPLRWHFVAPYFHDGLSYGVLPLLFNLPRLSQSAVARMGNRTLTDVVTIVQVYLVAAGYSAFMMTCRRLPTSWWAQYRRTISAYLRSFNFVRIGAWVVTGVAFYDVWRPCLTSCSFRHQS